MKAGLRLALRVIQLVAEVAVGIFGGGSKPLTRLTPLPRGKGVLRRKRTDSHV